MRSIDLNADLGEYPNSNIDERVMPFISSCNIACGGHIGNEVSVRQTIILAKKHGVEVGAHPSYPDREHFGREVLNIEPQELAQSIKEQILLVSRICQKENSLLHHVKLHGALYNQVASDQFMSELIMEVLRNTVPNTFWMGLANSESEKMAKKYDHPFIPEGFADRKYEPDGSLRPRNLENAILKPEQIMEQVEEMVLNHRVKSKDWMELNVRSICLHVDTEGAVTLAKKINQYLVNKGIQITTVQ